METTAIVHAESVITENPFKGPKSYEEQDLYTFYGREGEVAKLFQLIRMDVLSIVYSKSGIGKSSLLKAGLMPALRSNDYLPVYIRPDYSNPAINMQEFIIDQVAVSIERMNSASNGTIAYCFIRPEPGETLFEYFHRNPFYKFIPEEGIVREEMVPSSSKQLKPVLIFDQFEEIFTIGAGNENVHSFITTHLAYLIEKKTPPELLEKLKGYPGGESKLLQYQNTQKHYNIVFSFREEYFSNLENLSSYIPSVFYCNSRLRLTAFDTDIAKEIILRTSQFTIPANIADCLIKIITGGKTFKAKKDVEVEPFLLSLICFQLYNDIASNNEETIVRLEKADSLLVDEILKEYYESSLKNMPNEVRVFVEEELLTDKGNRTLHAVDDAEGKVGKEYIDKLVNEFRLLRKEEFLDSQHLEIIHDRLTPVILVSRHERRNVEAKKKLEEEAKLYQQKQEEENNKRLLEIDKQKAEELLSKAEELRKQIEEESAKKITEFELNIRKEVADSYEMQIGSLRHEQRLLKEQAENEKKTAIEQALQASRAEGNALYDKLKRAEEDIYRAVEEKKDALARVEYEKQLAIEQAIKTSELAKDALFENLKRAERDFLRIKEEKENLELEKKLANDRVISIEREFEQNKFHNSALQRELDRLEENNSYLDRRIVLLNNKFGRNSVLLAGCLILIVAGVASAAVFYDKLNSRNYQLITQIQRDSINYSRIIAESKNPNPTIKVLRDSLYLVQQTIANSKLGEGDKDKMIASLQADAFEYNNKIANMDREYRRLNDSLERTQIQLSKAVNADYLLYVVTDSLKDFEKENARLISQLNKLSKEAFKYPSDITKMPEFSDGIAQYATNIGDQYGILNDRIRELSYRIQKKK